MIPELFDRDELTLRYNMLIYDAPERKAGRG